MKIQNATAVVTGANRGIGLALTHALLARGAKRVYAGARDPRSVTQPGVVPLRLDVTDPRQVAGAAAEAGDVDLVINNAGIASFTSVLEPGSNDILRKELETNVFGMLDTSRAFAPILAKNGGGTLVNILSVVSWVSSARLQTYAITKSAAWSLTNALRFSLNAQQTKVIGAHFGFVDTDLTVAVDAPKLRPEDVANAILDGIEAGQDEILVDDYSKQVKAGLSAEPGVYTRPRG